MLISHRGIRPRISASAYVAPTAVICGDVEVGEDCCILFGAVIAAEGSPVRVGPRTVVMENVVIRGWPDLAVSIGRDCHLGVGASVHGATVGDEVFVAAGATIYPRAKVGARSVVRANAVVHIDAVLAENRRVPDGWTAIGNPAQVVPPGPDERMLVSAEGLNFTRAVFGTARDTQGMEQYLSLFRAHLDDEIIDELT